VYLRHKQVRKNGQTPPTGRWCSRCATADASAR